MCLLHTISYINTAKNTHIGPQQITTANYKKPLNKATYKFILIRTD